MVTHKTKEMLWKQILENPRDEELRLIYADVIEELGDEYEAQWIRANDYFDDTSDGMSFDERFIGETEDGRKEVLIQYLPAWGWRGFKSKTTFDFFDCRFTWYNQTQKIKEQKFLRLVSTLKLAIKKYPIGWVDCECFKYFPFSFLNRYWWGAKIKGLEKVYEPTKFDPDCSDDYVVKKVLEANFPTVEFTIE